jgi:hypothetical protein
MEFFFRIEFQLELLVGHVPTGRAAHYIFCFPKEGKQKDAISIPHANPVFIRTIRLIY